MTLMPRLSLLLLLLLAACSSATPTPTEPPTVRPGPTLPQSYPTLPPTWTLIFTPTVSDTPTVTRTPSITPTFTPSPTLEAQVLCDDFAVAAIPENGHAYKLSHYFSLISASSYHDVSIELAFTHRLQDGTIRYQFPGGLTYVLEIPLSELSGYGFYDWSLSLTDGARRGMCEVSGYFLIYATSEATATPEATPELTPEATEES